MERIPYGISCELGEIMTSAHKLQHKSQIHYNSGLKFFEATESREKFKANSLKELALDFSTDMSTRNAARRINRIRHESKGISATTLRNMVEREGKQIQECIEKKCTQVLEQNGFDSAGELTAELVFLPVQTKYIDQEVLAAAASALNIKEYQQSDYESPDTSLNISIDDVGVKRQAETRPKPEEDNQAKRVNNTVVHIQSEQGNYILNAANLTRVLKMLIGFLLHLGLMGRQIVIFADGARDIHSAVYKMLGFLRIKVILDWYHLEKKCKEQLSLAFCGRKKRNAFLEELLPCLWLGNVNGAIDLLCNVKDEEIKDHEKVVKLIEYFERVRNNIPCYALRKQLGLRNSSNLGEKANDLVVSNRQKHNGMSWSDDGSLAFATVSATTLNRQTGSWIHHRDVSFEFHIPVSDVA